MRSKRVSSKRTANTTSYLARKKPTRSSYDRVLIVCEGSNTEPNYFTELLDYFKLNSANVEVDGDCGSSPIGVVEYAIKRYRQEKGTGDRYDRVFCVFDKDAHSTYREALTKIATLNPKNIFKAINSVPCFEYWLLLHFEFTTKPYIKKGSKSSCQILIADLKKYLPNYSKGGKGIYSALNEKTDQALTRSKKTLLQAYKSGTDNPTTQIHGLVEYLQNLKD